MLRARIKENCYSANKFNNIIKFKNALEHDFCIFHGWIQINSKTKINQSIIRINLLHILMENLKENLKKNLKKLKKNWKNWKNWNQKIKRLEKMKDVIVALFVLLHNSQSPSFPTPMNQSSEQAKDQ